MVDQLELAQFVYFILDNKQITKVFNTMTGRAVLILGRFTEDRKRLLEAIKARLRQEGYLPIIFDFQKPKARDFTETVQTLAGLSRFVIANIGKPRSVQQELQATIPNFEIPFLPIIEKGEHPYSMFKDLERKAWVAGLVSYANQNELLRNFHKLVRQGEDLFSEIVGPRTASTFGVNPHRPPRYPGSERYRQRATRGAGRKKIVSRSD